jgi:outer membrane protein
MSLRPVAVVATLAAFAAAAQETQRQTAQPGAMTLEQAIAIAAERNPDLRRVELQALQAEADLVAARSAILPHLDFNASASAIRSAPGATFVSNFPFDQTTFYAGPAYAVGLSLRQLLFDGGKWWENLAAAHLALSASREQAAEQRMQVAFLVEQRFYELVRAARHLRVLDDAGIRSAEQAQVVDQLAQRRVASPGDVYAAQANRDNDAINRHRQRAVVEQARLDLAAAIGVDPSEPLQIAQPLLAEPSPPPPAAQAVESALRNRPILVAAENQLRAQGKAARALVGDYWPTISLSGSYSRDVPSLDALVGAIDRTSLLVGSVNFSWNLFNGLGNKAQIDRARVQALILKNDLESARRNVATDVHKAIAAMMAALESARLAQESERVSADALRQARARQQGGMGSQYEERDAELRLTQSQLARVAALVDGRIADAALRRATGAR